MQESDSPSQVTRARAEKLKEILDYMGQVTKSSLDNEIKFDQLDQFYSFLTKFGTEDVTEASLMKSPCSSQFSYLQKRTRSRFVVKISEFLFEMEKNKQVIHDLEGFIERGKEMKNLIKAKSYNAYHDLGNELNKELLANITESELHVSLQIAKDLVHAITTHQFTDFEEPQLTSAFGPVMQKLESALDPVQKGPSQPRLSQIVEEEKECFIQEPQQIGIQLGEVHNPMLDRGLDQPIATLEPQKPRGEGVELWNFVMDRMEYVDQKESVSEMKKLQNESRRDVMVKSLCLTNLMMKMLREDYNRLLHDIETVPEEKLSLKYILASKRIQEQIQRLKEKPKDTIEKFQLPEVKSFDRKQIQHWKKVITKGETLRQVDLLKFNKPIVNAFSRATAQSKSDKFVEEIPCSFEEEHKERPFKEMQNVNKEEMTKKTRSKRQMKSHSKLKERSMISRKEGSRTPQVIGILS